MVDIQVSNLTKFFVIGENLLEDLSFDIQEGECVAILGRNGSGKSTLAKLLNLVIDDLENTSGEILVDGVNIKDISQHSLRSQIGVVLQETFLFATVDSENSMSLELLYRLGEIVVGLVNGGLLGSTLCGERTVLHSELTEKLSYLRIVGYVLGNNV